MRSRQRISWRAYPALLLAGFLAAGIVGSRLIAGIPCWGWFAGTLSAAALVFWARRRDSRSLVTLAPLLHTASIALLFVALGGLRHAAFYQQAPNHVAHLLEGEANRSVRVVLEGKVSGASTAREHSVRFRMNARRLFSHDTLAVDGKVLVTWWRPRNVQEPSTAPSVQPGDVVRVRGLLRPPPQQRNPADFDYGAYLRRRGLFATLTVDEAGAIVRTERSPSMPERATTALRQYARQQLPRLVARPSSQHVLTALVLGERHHLRGEVEDRFARHGLMHLLAVSGLHVLLVGMVLYRMLRPMLLRVGVSRRLMEGGRATLTLLVLTIYMVLTGASPSVVRAVVMAGLFIGAVLAQRSVHPLNTLGVAALVLLLWRPTRLFDVGFQLSFAAVAAVVTMVPRLMNRASFSVRRSRVAGGVLELFVVSLAATLGTLPVLLYHFGHVSFAGLVLNLAAVPLTMLGLGAGLVGLLLAEWWFAGAAVWGAAADVLVQGLLFTAQMGDILFSWAALDGYLRDPWMLAAIVALLVMGVQWSRPRLRWRMGLAALALLTCGLWLNVLSGAYAPRLEVLFLDVGQGDAALVTMPNKHRLLVDAGPRTAFTNRGGETIVRHLERYGVRKLDAVVATHAHADHLGGLPTLLREVSIGRVGWNGQPHTSSLYAETQHLLDSLGVSRRTLQAGDTLSVDEVVRVQVLAPFEHALDGATANNASVVLRVAYGQTDVLLTGDAEASAERALVRRYGELLTSDVVKVPHHGSATSSTSSFVKYAAAGDSDRAVVSVSRRNSFGLPDTTILTRWRRHTKAVYTTAKHGAVWLQSDGSSFKQVGW